MPSEISFYSMICGFTLRGHPVRRLPPRRRRTLKIPLPFPDFPRIVPPMTTGPHILATVGAFRSAMPLGLLLLSRL